mgnify:FL=1
MSYNLKLVAYNVKILISCNLKLITFNTQIVLDSKKVLRYTFQVLRMEYYFMTKAIKAEVAKSKAIKMVALNITFSIPRLV